MFKIIFDQLMLRQVPWSAYDAISKAQAWIWATVISLVVALDAYFVEHTLYVYAVNAVLGPGLVYVCYRVFAWWMKRGGYWNGEGNLWGLVVSTGTIDMAYGFISLIPVWVSVGAVLYSLTIFFHALKNAFALEGKTTFKLVLIFTLFALIFNTAVVVIAIVTGILPEPSMPAEQPL